MDSISYITKQHCRSVFNIGIVLLLLLLCGVNVMTLLHSPGVLSAVGVATAAVFAVLVFIHLFGGRIGCTLLQIPVAVFTAAVFFAAVMLGSAGFMLATHEGAEEYINVLLQPFRYQLAIHSQTVGVILNVFGVLLLLVATCAFLTISYLGTLKNCLDDEINRGSTRAFCVLSTILFVIFTVLIVIGIALFAGSMQQTVLGIPLLSLTIQAVIVDLILLMTGLSARSFISKTYAFKVFESQMMKVETNADGTVYVPINEDADENAAFVPPAILPSNPPDEKKRGKPYIPKTPFILSDEGEKQSAGERHIL